MRNKPLGKQASADTRLVTCKPILQAERTGCRSQPESLRCRAQRRGRGGQIMKPLSLGICRSPAPGNRGQHGNLLCFRVPAWQDNEFTEPRVLVRVSIAVLKCCGQKTTWRGKGLFQLTIPCYGLQGSHSLKRLR